ncbi:MAG: IS4 family transposase [Flavobacteriales bacterium]|nr:IS4 family transposase [Flavobacteriales bacterium]
MNKSTYFTGQPIISQIIKLINREKVSSLAKTYRTDHYYKKLKTYNHLVSMLYTIYSGCTSIREVVTGLLASSTKLNHLGIDYTPRKSTLSDANCNRDHRVFEAIHQYLYKQYSKNLPDSRKEQWHKRLYIMDSTTISLFQEILKNAGRSPMNGKRKGGIKAHTLIKADEDVPQIIRLTAAAANDAPFMKEINLPSGSLICFDKAYCDFNVWDQWSQKKISFVTRLRKGSIQTHLKDRNLTISQEDKGVISDKEVMLGGPENDNVTKVRVRLITYFDEENQRELVFVTNNFHFAPYTVSQIYKRRWQIETLYKRIKQSYPLRHFLGDNENAIKIQIWCALIADLLLKVIHRQARRRWAFSNLASMVRLHLFTYINLGKFLNDPERELVKLVPKYSPGQASLFPT